MPLLYAINATDPNTQFLFVSMGVILATTGVLLFIFVPKVLGVRHGVDPSSELHTTIDALRISAILTFQLSFSFFPTPSATSTASQESHHSKEPNQYQTTSMHKNTLGGSQVFLGAQNTMLTQSSSSLAKYATEPSKSASDLMAAVGDIELQEA